MPAASRPNNVMVEFENGPLSRIAQRVPFWKGVPLGAQGEPCGSLYLIVRGRVLLSRRVPEGDEYTLALLGPGEMFGEGAFTPDACWLATPRPITDGVMRVISATDLPRAVQTCPELASHLLTLMSARLERTHQRMDLIAGSTARERILGLFSLMAAYHGQVDGHRVWLPLGLSQAQIGEMVGLARETVARVIAGLKEEGIILGMNRAGVWVRLPEQLGLLVLALAGNALQHLLQLPLVGLTG